MRLFDDDTAAQTTDVTDVTLWKRISPERFRAQGFRIHFVGTNAPTRPNGLHYVFLCPERFARLTRGASEYPVMR